MREERISLGISELEMLIREQRADDTSLQRPEHHAIALPLLAEKTDRVYQGPDRRGCPVHSKVDWRLNPDGSMRCNGCHRENQTALRRAHGIKARPKGPQCGHDLIARTLRPTGEVRCSQCDRVYNRTRRGRR